MKNIAVLTSGGDAPGMNACLRSVVRSSVLRGAGVAGIRRGFAGMIDGESAVLDARAVSGIISTGGTILKTARSDEFRHESGRRKAARSIERLGIDGLIIIGGDGSFMGGCALGEETGLPVIGIPATIDNDVCGTDYSIGFDTAVNTAVSAVDRIRDTASSHDRLFIVEVMGRGSGFIALYTALAGGAEDVLLPEISTDIDGICGRLEDGKKRGKLSSIIVAAEGDETGGAFGLARAIGEKTGYEVRVTILGHTLRGGVPGAFDRVLATRLGDFAVELLLEGESGKAVGVRGGALTAFNLESSFGSRKEIDEKLYSIVLGLAI